jgi:hypothetical protein
MSDQYPTVTFDADYPGELYLDDSAEAIGAVETGRRYAPLFCKRGCWK